MSFHHDNPSRRRIAVVGGGLAGLSAAVRAGELGCEAVVLEAGQDAAYPCNSRFAMGIFHVAFSDVMSAPDKLYAAVMDATCSEANPELVRMLTSNVRRAVDWLSGQGVRFINGNRHAWMSRTLSPPVPRRAGLNWQGRAGDVVLQRLTARLTATGGQLLLGARAVDLMVEAGHCRGIRYETGGKSGELSAQAVIVADGGFQGNLDLIGEHISRHPESLCIRNAGTGKGAGLEMARRAGARITSLLPFYGHVQCVEAMTSRRLWPYPTLDMLCCAGLLVGADGRRFADEGLGGIYLANAMARRKKYGPTAVIFDDAIWEDVGRDYIVPVNPLAVEAGAKLISSPTIEGLAAQLGLPTEALREEVTVHNAFVDGTNNPGAVPRTRRWTERSIRTAPFHAFRACSGLTYTMGGIAVNGRGEVLSEAGGVISGLLAAGATTGGLEGGPNAGYAGGLSKALVMGLTCAETVALRPEVTTAN